MIRPTEIVFVVQLQTLHEISHRKKTLSKNLTGELNATNIKKFEINPFFNTTFFV